MKRLPPPPRPPSFEREDYFTRFENLVCAHDTNVENYKRLRQPAGTDELRTLMLQLEPDGDAADIDTLEKLWPDEKNIYVPSRDYIVKRLSLLVGSFPNVNPHSPKVYTSMLVSRVAVKQPSCMVLESACNELVDTFKYNTAPNIADLLLLLDKHEKLWQKRLDVYDEIQSGRALTRAQERLAYEEEEEQKRVDRCVRRLTKVNQLELAAKVREGGIDMVEQAMPTLEKWDRVDSVAHRLTLVERLDLAARVREGGIDMVEQVMPMLEDLEREQSIERARREREERERRARQERCWCEETEQYYWRERGRRIPL